MNSKPIIAGLIGISAFQGVWALTPHAGEKSPCRKPNVVIFFTDDQGAIDLNCFGAKTCIPPILTHWQKKG